MFDVQALRPGDLHRLSSSEKNVLMLQMLSHIGHQSTALQVHQAHIEQQSKALKFKDAKIEKITFELQRLKCWQFGAHSERMTAEQRQLSRTRSSRTGRTCRQSSISCLGRSAMRTTLRRSGARCSAARTPSSWGRTTTSATCSRS